MSIVIVNPLPDLLTYAFFAPLMLRIAAASVFAYLAVQHFRNKKEAAQEFSILSQGTATIALGMYVFAECIVAVGLFLGLYTQIAALLGAAICFKVLFLRRSLRHLAPLSRATYALTSIICLSLLLTGAGAFAFDLPL